MKTFSKDKNKNFVILNLSDPQMGDEDWAEGHPHKDILTYTINELVNRVQPDLITITGDVAWADHYTSYENLSTLLDATGIPWAPVWGNHDHQCGTDSLLKAAAMLKKHPLCLLEDGDPAFGHGNYILTIDEDGTPVTALFMIDSHNSTEVEENGTKRWAYDKLWPNQLTWIGQQAAALKEQGYKDAVMLLHIPLYCYRAAAEKIFPGGRGGDSEIYGRQHELIASHPMDEGALPIIKENGLITHVLAGHDHCNNFIVDHDGIKLMFACKTGAGCYWQSAMNGGTVITIDSNGIRDVHHEFVDTSHLTMGKNIKEFVYEWK